MLIAEHAAASSSPIWAPYVALGVSGLALFISGASLWRTHFSPMRLLIASGPLDLRITPFRSGKSRWFVADGIADFTFTNAGARPGVIRSMRLRVEYPTLPIPRAREYFELDSEVDSREFDKHANNRLEWKETASIGEGAPFILLPKESQAKRLVFWGRWENPVIQPLIVFTLEVYSEHSKKWKAYDTWKHVLHEPVWVRLANERGCMSAFPDNRPSLDSEVNPPDLHKYTGTKDDLTKIKIALEPSYLDYPDSNE